jgi:hypothetical protein
LGDNWRFIDRAGKIFLSGHTHFSARIRIKRSLFNFENINRMVRGRHGV